MPVLEVLNRVPSSLQTPPESRCSFQVGIKAVSTFYLKTGMGRGEVFLKNVNILKHKEKLCKCISLKEKWQQNAVSNPSWVLDWRKTSLSRTLPGQLSKFGCEPESIAALKLVCIGCQRMS